MSDTQDELMCLRNGIYIFRLTSSLCDKISGERSRAYGRYSFKYTSSREGLYTFAKSVVMFNCVLSLSHVVYWVRCGT